MKKFILSVICLSSLAVISQEDKTWRLGVQWGLQGNRAVYEGGMSEANARFHQDKCRGNSLNIAARYDLNKHWMIMSGLGSSNYGFGFALAEDYSLLQRNHHFSALKTRFRSIEIPAMIYYKFNPNCRNTRWLIGAGLVENLVGTKTINKSLSQTSDGSSNVNYLSTNTTVNGGNYWMLRCVIGRERTFNNGTILTASMVFNVGFGAIAHSTVNYTIDNVSYTHSFCNKGNFIGFRLAYFWKPLNKPASGLPKNKSVKS